MSRTLALGLAILLALAGCSGSAGLGGDRTSATVTPAPVPTDAAPAAPDGGIDAALLAASHDRALSTTNYTVVVRQRVVVEGRTIRRTVRHREVAAGASAYSATREQESSGFPPSSVAAEIAYWYNGSVALFRFGAGENAHYRRSDEPGWGPLLDPDNDGRIRAVFAAVHPGSVDRLEDGSFLVDTTRLRDPTALPTPTFVGPPRQARLTAVVGPDGVVREYRLVYESTIPEVNRSVRVVRHVRFTHVGNTSVRAPAWTRSVPREKR